MLDTPDKLKGASADGLITCRDWRDNRAAGYRTALSLTLAAPASRPNDCIRVCRSSRRRWWRRGQILQIEDHACRGAARASGVDRANERRPCAVYSGVKTVGEKPAFWRRSVCGWGREKRRAGRDPSLLGRFSLTGIASHSRVRDPVPIRRENLVERLFGAEESLDRASAATLDGDTDARPNLY